jgi:outer membrane scaffolding protein for murein synthesis (MipA/OmpV family)
MNKKTLLITGGSTGIGLATGELFLERGFRVILLARDREADYKVTVTVPLRAIFAVSLSRVRRVGWISSPRLNVDVFRVSPWKINLGLSTGPVFGDRDYHDYFYSVDPEFVNLDRPAYSAPGGYSGTQLTLSASKRVAKWWFGAFVRGDFLSGAAFRQSPLLKARQSVMAGVSVSWSFAESTTLVTVDE